MRWATCSATLSSCALNEMGHLLSNSLSCALNEMGHLLSNSLSCALNEMGHLLSNSLSCALNEMGHLLSNSFMILKVTCVCYEGEKQRPYSNFVPVYTNVSLLEEALVGGSISKLAKHLFHHTRMHECMHITRTHMYT